MGEDKRMKLLLVRPNISVRWYIQPPMGLMFISAAAKKAGHEVVIIDAWLHNYSAIEAAHIIGFTLQSDVIGIQVFDNTVEWTRDFIYEVSNFPSEIIIGGPYVSAIPEQALVETGADVAIVGEFDNNIDDVLFPILAGKERIIHMPTTDVNVTPIPDWEACPPPDYWHYMSSMSQPTKGKRIAVVLRSRGCPFQCTFCSPHVVHGNKVRFREDDNILEEIKYLQNKWNINEIWFGDDNFLVSYDRSIDLLHKLIPYKLHIRFPNGIRIENIDEKMVKAMKAAGVYFTGIGIESGNPRVLKRVKKNNNLEQTKKAIGLLNKHGISTIGFFILGLPTETRLEMEDTVKFAMSTKLNHAQFGTFLSYPGAEDYKSKPELSEEELINIQRDATLRFYRQPRIIWDIIKHFRFSQLRAFIHHNWVKRWFE